MAKERELVKQLLDEGVEAGAFDPSQAERFPGIYQMAFQGIDYCHMRRSFDQIGTTADRIRHTVTDYLIASLTRHEDRGEAVKQ